MLSWMTFGFGQLLHEKMESLNVVVLGGNGGVGTAIIHQLFLENVNSILSVVRDAKAHTAKVHIFDTYIRANKSKTTLRATSYEKLSSEDLSKADIVINCTNVGLTDGCMPITIEQLENVNPNAVIYDVIARETPLLREAKRFGFQTQNGESMLSYNMLSSIKLWDKIVVE